MADPLSPARRSANMRAIRSKDTKPELVVRRLIFGMGRRYRLHRRDLPGRPDIALIGRRQAVFVHGCFWHQHPGCREGRPPRTRPEYWGPKLARNVERDRDAERRLEEQGWRVLTVWECETGDQESLRVKLECFLTASRNDNPTSSASLSASPPPPRG